MSTDGGSGSRGAGDAPESRGRHSGEEPGGQARPRRRHRRVVALSDVDRRRLEAGEITDPVEALHAGDAGPVEPSDEPEQGEGPNDARLRRDVPPHWGRS